MGAKKSKESANNNNNNNNDNSLKKIRKLGEKDLNYLSSSSGLSKEDIKQIYDQFMQNNPDAQLNKSEFIQLYNKLRPEHPHLLNEISEHIFRAFDLDKSNTISFSEFLIAYALTSRGELKRKLDYAFWLYDIDSSGFLDKDEMRVVLAAMLQMLSAKQYINDLPILVNEIANKIDVNRDGKISKGKINRFCFLYIKKKKFYLFFFCLNRRIHKWPYAKL